MSSRSPTLKKFAERGIEHCRRGEWDAGMAYLVRVAEDESGDELPSTFHSYLGFGLAHHHRRIREGMDLCRHACRVSFYEPENFLNLARTSLLAGKRDEAFQAIRQGRALDPGSLQLRELHDKLGIRRQPVLRFLRRRNLINQILGRFRHDLRRKSPIAAW